MTFLILAGLLLAITTLWASRPWWSKPKGSHVNRVEANVQVYQSRLREIEADTHAGLISVDTAESLRQEQGQRLLLDADGEAAAASTTTAQLNRWVVPVLGLSLALGSLALYYQRGSWKLDQDIRQVRASPSTPEGKTLPPEVLAMVQGLEQKLVANPKNPEGWAQLGRSYRVMERYADAAKAFHQANEQKPDQVEWLTDEGEALALSRDRDLLGMPQQLFERALALAPSDGKTLWYAALASAQAGDFATAKTRLLQLSRQDLPPAMASVVQERLQEFAQASGQAVVASPSAATSSPANPASDTPVRLQVQLSLSPELAQRWQQGAMAGKTLFVFAKAESGPPMPLAVQRLALPANQAWPMTVSLESSMSMVPGLGLESVPSYRISARISNSGDVTQKSGDWQGTVGAKQPKAGETGLVTVVIDEVLP